MATATQQTSGPSICLALMANGDDLFNARDWQTLDDVHHPDMIAQSRGAQNRSNGREAHGAAMQQLVKMFPDIRVHTRTRSQFARRRLDHSRHQRHRDLRRGDDPADGNVIRRPGKAFDLEFAQTSRWDGDQLIIISAFWDTALQAKQLGLAG